MLEISHVGVMCMCLRLNCKAHRPSHAAMMHLPSESLVVIGKGVGTDPQKSMHFCTNDV